MLFLSAQLAQCSCRFEKKAYPINYSQIQMAVAGEYWVTKENQSNQTKSENHDMPLDRRIQKFGSVAVT